MMMSTFYFTNRLSWIEQSADIYLSYYSDASDHLNDVIVRLLATIVTDHGFDPP
jgi:hypothetical protein